MTKGFELALMIKTSEQRQIEEEIEEVRNKLHLIEEERKKMNAEIKTVEMKIRNTEQITPEITQDIARTAILKEKELALRPRERELSEQLMDFRKKYLELKTIIEKIEVRKEEKISREIEANEAKEIKGLIETRGIVEIRKKKKQP